MTTLSTWQLPPDSAAKTNPPVQLSPAAQVLAGADARHRAHCPMCTDEPGDAEAFVAALFNVHAPWLTGKPAAALTRPDRPRPAQLLTKRGQS